MAALITDAFIKQYQDTFELALQQGDSRLSPYVKTRTGLKGEGIQPARYIEPFDFAERTARLAATTYTEVDVTTRWVAPRKWETSKHIDRTDPLMVGGAIVPEVTQAIRRAAFRLKDDIIIAALGGDAKTGKDGTTTTPLPASQVVDTNVGGSGTGMNKAKILAALELLEENDVDDDEQIVFVVGPRQHSDLRKLAELMDSKSKVSAEVRDGRVVSVLGARVIRTNRLPKTGAVRDCFMFVSSRVFLGIWDELFTRVTEDPNKSFAILMYAEAIAEATRLDEKAVVKIQATE